MGKRQLDISGKWAVVTGASSGIGLCFANELARRGSGIILISNEREALESAAADISDKYGVRTLPVFLDLTADNVVEEILEIIDRKGISPEILINNAGIFNFRKVTDMSVSRINLFIDLHCRAVTLLSSAFAGRFAGRGEGWMLNMSSMSCWMPMPGIAMYSATKAYIRVFTRALHYEMRDRNVKVMAACPGGIATSLFGLPDNLMRLAIRLHAVQTPEKFVNRAVDKMLKGKKQYINGVINRLAILFIGLTPTYGRMLVQRLMLDKGIAK